MVLSRASSPLSNDSGFRSGKFLTQASSNSCSAPSRSRLFRSTIRPRAIILSRRMVGQLRARGEGRRSRDQLQNGEEEAWVDSESSSLGSRPATRHSLFPLQRALLDLVPQPEDEHADEEQDGTENRDIVGKKLPVDEGPRDQ